MTIKDGKVFANSRDVAEYFGKRHDHVLRDIDTLLLTEPACAPNFGETSAQVPMPRGGVRSERAYDMTRDGFTLLAMGFTGKRHDNVLRAIDRLDCSEKFRSLNFEESFLGVETGRGAHRVFRTFDMTRDGFTLLAMGFTGREVTRVRKGIPTRNKGDEALSVLYGLTDDLSDDIPIMSLTLSDKGSCTMKIAYARVSSTGQNEAAQVDILNRQGAEEIFIEKASGTSRDGRPKLAEAIKFARRGDVLMVTRLDRLARSVSDLHAIAKELQAKGVDLVVTEQNIDTTTPTGRLMFNMLGAIAEFETDLRKERQLEGIAKAKAEGRYKGRPVTVDGDAIRAALAAGDKPSAVAKRFNVARSTVYRVMAEAA